jgi:hypothetical protein
MSTVAGQLALIVTAMSTGAALYVLVCEQPARLTSDDRALLAEFKPSYKSGLALRDRSSSMWKRPRMLSRGQGFAGGGVRSSKLLRST